MDNQTEINEVFFDPFDKMSFSFHDCFLCGKAVSDKKSVEHIFPKWLLHRYDLWNEELVLLNKTAIPYRFLTIPCCKECNNNFLSKIENTIRTGVEKGFDEFIKIDELTIFQWVAKIYYGLFFKELSLLLDVKDSSKGTIVTPEFIKRFNVLHGLMQSVTKPFEFVSSVPWSIFIVRTLPFNDKNDFDYSDGFEVMTFSIRLGEISIIVCLEDNGTQKYIASDHFQKFNGIKLHPIQFDELTAKVMYTEYLRNRTPKYLSILPEDENEKTFIFPLPLQGMSSKPVYDEWNQKEYAVFLLRAWEKWGLTFDDIFKEPNQVLTFLFSEISQLKILDINCRIIEERSV